MQDLKALKKRLSNLLAQGQVSPIIKELKALLPEDSPRWRELILLEKRQNEANLKRLRGTLSDNDLQIRYNRISEDLLTLIDLLAPADLVPGQDTSVLTTDGKVRQGSILYKIPTHMTLQEETVCIVRVAFEEEQIIRNIDLDQDVKLLQRRVSNIMQAELYDPSEEKPFRISSPNNAEQFVDEDDYTEWLFLVTPVLPGEHPLWLKIAVIEEVRGKERKREVVLRQKINILTEAVSEPSVSFKQVMELQLAFGMPAYTEEEEVTFPPELDDMMPPVAKRIPSSRPGPRPRPQAPQAGSSGNSPVRPASRSKGSMARILRPLAFLLIATSIGGYLFLNMPGENAKLPIDLEETSPEEGEDLPLPAPPDKVKPLPSRTMGVRVLLGEDWADGTLFVDGKQVAIRQDNGTSKLISVQMSERPRNFEVRLPDGQVCRVSKVITPGDQTLVFPCE